MPKIYNFSRQQWLILSVTSLGSFMASLNTSIINIALPSITSFYQAPLSSAEWVIMVYLVLLSSLLLIFGRLGDMYGYKKIYVIGFILFTLASLLIVWSPDIFTLISLRGLQALGAAMVIAIVQAILAASFPPGERGRAIGFNSMVVSLGLASGPSIGGLLVNFLSWKSIFFINIPIGIIGSIWAWQILPSHQGTKQRFDLVGAGAFFISQLCLLLALSHGQSWGWGSNMVISLLIAAVVSLVFFIYWENAIPFPMLRLKLFSNRLFAAANSASFFNYLAQYAVTFLMPFYLISTIHLPVYKAGLILTAFPVMMMVTSPISGYWVDKIGSRTLTVLGMGLVATATYILSNLAPDTSLVIVVIGLGLVGVGTGLFLTPNNTAIMSSVPPNEVGIGSGMIATMRSLGQVMGVAVSGAVLNTRMAHYATIPTNSPERIFSLAQNDAFLVATLFAIMGLVASLKRGKHQ